MQSILIHHNMHMSFLPVTPNLLPWSRCHGINFAFSVKACLCIDFVFRPCVGVLEVRTRQISATVLVICSSFQLTGLRNHWLDYNSHGLNYKCQTCRERFVPTFVFGLRITFITTRRIHNLLLVLVSFVFETHISPYLKAWFFFIKVSN